VQKKGRSVAADPPKNGPTSKFAFDAVRWRTARCRQL
jgi:hypothetical protein